MTYAIPEGSLNAVLLGVEHAEDFLVRNDCFSERTLNLLDELRDELQAQVITRVN